MTKQQIPEYIIKGIEKAIEISKNCKDEDENPHPKVGAVLIKDEEIIETAYRGELKEGEHAEFTLLQRKSKLTDYKDTILITALEPCTKRGVNKTPCVEWIINSGIKEVWIGLDDPNPYITHKGSIKLMHKGIVIERFPYDYTYQVKELCKEFWDSEMNKYNHDAMAISPKIEIKSKIVDTIEGLSETFRPFLNQCVNQEDYIDCLGDKIPLIKDYNLFNFSLEAKEASELTTYFNFIYLKTT